MWMARFVSGTGRYGKREREKRGSVQPRYLLVHVGQRYLLRQTKSYCQSKDTQMSSPICRWAKIARTLSRHQRTRAQSFGNPTPCRTWKHTIPTRLWIRHPSRPNIKSLSFLEVVKMPWMSPRRPQELVNSNVGSSTRSWKKKWAGYEVTLVPSTQLLYIQMARGKKRNSGLNIRPHVTDPLALI